MSLSELEGRFRSSTGPERHRLAVELAWARAAAGELGRAFEALWEPEEGSVPAHLLLLSRAELQAHCGNEDAALATLGDLGTAVRGAQAVRARVALARGDWDEALRWSEDPALPSDARPRMDIIAARSRFELACLKNGWAAVDEDGIQARTEQARREAQVSLEADGWADLCALRLARGDEEAARRAALRAVALWDDMATTLPPPLRSGFWTDARRRSTREASRQAKDSGAAGAKNGLQLLVSVLRRLTSERDLDRLLALVTDGAIRISGAERGYLLLVGDDGALEAKTVRGAEAELGPETAAFSRSIAETVLIDRDPVITVDATRDARVQDYLSVHQLMLKSVACLPVEAGGRIWGVLYLEHRSASGRFDGADLSMLRAFADQAGIALETAQMIQQIDRQRRDLERANTALREANHALEQRLHGREEVLQRTQREIVRLQANGASGEPWGLVGVSEPMRRLYDTLERVAANDVPVVIAGESGTGKELVARAIHRGSGRAGGPYVSMSCGAIPEGLLESELFGHVAGAFTGATHARPGLFVEAQGGTLFMDEIEDMSPRMQLDLLRVLQERHVRPVGATSEVPVDVRIITASKRSLRALIDEGGLREDLFYRLAVVEILVPPLRERRADVPLLCDHFLGRIAKERGEPKKRLSRDALRRLTAHTFPGNVRELEHLLVNASVFATNEVIEGSDLSIEPSEASWPIEGDAASYRDFKDAERERILAALNANDWNRAQAARSLGMPRRTFYRRLKQHGIELPKETA